MSKTVAVIDDDLLIRVLVSDYLESLGYKVTCYSDGKSALEDLEAVLPDLIFLDMQMPGMNGGEVLQAVRSNHRLSGIPVIICSAANDIAEYTEHNFKVKADSYLSKPFEVSTLYNLVKKMLNE